MEIEGIITGLLLGCSLLALSFGLKKPLVGGAAGLIVFLVTMLSTGAGFVLFLLGAFALLLSIQPTNRSTGLRNGPEYCVTSIAGPLAGRQYYLTARKPVLELGRENCDIQFPWETKGVGRHHCKLMLQGGRAYLLDNNSTYGTYLKQPMKKLLPQTPEELENGAEFWLASNQIAFRINRI